MAETGLDEADAAAAGPDLTGHGVVDAGQPERNRYVDFLRVLSIGLVVIGHWLVTSPVYRAGGFQAPDVLAIIHWGGWVTLAFQVMPVFFLVGGYAAAISWRGHQARGATARAWLTGRAMRLLIPTTMYVVIALVGAECAVRLHAPVATLGLAGWAIALQLWFLPVYLALTALTPVLHAAHRRWGLWVPATAIALGIAVDFVVIDGGVKPLGWLNYLLIWGALYQTGFSWQDGTLTRNRRLLVAIAAAGTALFLVLVLIGPFPVSLIGVTGQTVNNTAPPSAALAAYAAVQTALLIMATPYVSRWLRRPRVWNVVDRANEYVMPVYLWHMVPVLVTGITLYAGGVMPEAGVGSLRWWVLRVPWVAANSVVLCALMVLLNPLIKAAGRRPGRLSRACVPRSTDHAERTRVGVDASVAAGSTTRTRSAPQPGAAIAAALLWAGIVAVGFALYRFAVYGFAPAGAFPTTAAACYLAGLLLLAGSLATASARRRSRPDAIPTAAQ